MKSPIRKIIVYDLETGGLSSKLHALTEIALVAINTETLEIVEEWSSLIKPYSEELTYTQDALEITKLTVDRIKEKGNEAAEVRKSIVEFIERHTEGSHKPVLAGHNIIKFDNPFFDKFMKEEKVDVFKLLSPDIQDTLKMAHLRWPELPNYSLGTCANEVGQTLVEAHRALPDTVANAKFLIKMLKNLRGEGSAETSYKRRKFNFNF